MKYETSDVYYAIIQMHYERFGHFKYLFSENDYESVVFSGGKYGSKDEFDFSTDVFNMIKDIK